MADITKKDAIALGCRCDECPLKDADGPVLPECAKGAQFTVLTEYPGPEEIKEGRPLVGSRAKLFDLALRNAGLSRHQTAIVPVVMCQPPKAKMKIVLAKIRSSNAERKRQNTQIKKANEKAAKQGLPLEPLLPLIPTPQECCRPGVVNVLRRGLPPFIFAMGKDSAGLLLGGDPSISAIRGSILDGNVVSTKHGNQLYGPEIPVADVDVLVHNARIVPSLPVGQVFSERRWMETFTLDLDRLVRWRQGKLRWSEPEIIYSPSPEYLRAFLEGPGPFTYDVETDSRFPLLCNMRCIGIGNADRVVIVGVRSKLTPRSTPGDDHTFYPPDALAEVRRILAYFFSRPDKLKVGHNAGYYDRLAIRHWLGVEVNPTLDTILIHRLVESELPHSLGFVGSKYTDVHSWKADRQGRKLATEAENDHELHHYCGLDVAVTARVLGPLLREVKKVGQDKLVNKDHLVQRVCADMHHVGMFVDLEAQAKAEAAGIKQIVKLRERVRSLADDADFNPGSTKKLRDILYSNWGLTPPLKDDLWHTDTGDPSTSDAVLRSLLSLDNLSEQQRGFILALRKYRKVMKEVGTYIVKLRPMSEVIPDIGWDEDEEEDDTYAREEWESRGYGKRGIVWADGRMRPGYNAHVALTGRLSSSSPINAQNFPKHLRRLIIPQPGHVLIGADYDQLELRIAAARWGLSKYLQAFAEGLDPHTAVTAMAIFGDAFVAAAGTPGPWKSGTKFKGDANEMRQLSKIIQYAYQYMASVETGARIIQSTEISDPDTGGTKLPYLKMAVRRVREMRSNWLQGIPELERGWAREIQFFRSNGYIEEPIHGRRRFCKDGENPNELVNFPIQGSAAGLVNDAMIGIWRDIPLHKWGPGTGLLTQTHDAMVVEAPIDKAQEVIEIINHHMNKRHPALPGVDLTASAEAGYSWKEVG